MDWRSGSFPLLSVLRKDLLQCPFDFTPHVLSDGQSEHGRDSVANLSEAGVHGAGETEAVRKGLKARCFAHGDRALLSAVPVNVRVAVLAKMSGQGPGGRSRLKLPPFVRKFARIVRRNVFPSEIGPFLTSFLRPCPDFGQRFLEDLFSYLQRPWIICPSGHSSEDGKVAGRQPDEVSVRGLVAFKAWPFPHATRIARNLGRASIRQMLTKFAPPHAARVTVMFGDEWKIR